MEFYIRDAQVSLDRMRAELTRTSSTPDVNTLAIAATRVIRDGEALYRLAAKP